MTARTWQEQMTERDMQENLRMWALQNGWMPYHTADSRRSHPGFPDLVCVKDGHLLFIELKSQKGRISPWQRVWLDCLADVPSATVVVVRPTPKDGEISYDDALELLAKGPGA